MERKPLLVFQTDFTYKEGAVAAMYGVVKSVDRDLEIMTATHDLPQYDMWSASYRLYQYVPFWPKGTIFVSVVDPGVGTSRKACVAKLSSGYYVVTPDNGALTHVKRAYGIDEVREIDETINRLKTTEGTSVFHGRDLFGYCAARLASGVITYEQVGPKYPVEDIVSLPVLEPEYTGNGVRGIIEIDDPNFGNAWTNIPTNDFLAHGFRYGETVKIIVKDKGKVIYDKDTVFGKTFGVVKKGEPILYNNELMRLSLALSQGSFIKEYGITFGPDVTIEITH